MKVVANYAKAYRIDILVDIHVVILKLVPKARFKRS